MGPGLITVSRFIPGGTMAVGISAGVLRVGEGDTILLASTRYRVAVAMRVAHEAPSQAPTRLPASRLITTGHSAPTSARGFRGQSGRVRRNHDDQAHGLVHDHRREGREPEHTQYSRCATRESRRSSPPTRGEDSGCVEGRGHRATVGQVMPSGCR